MAVAQQLKQEGMQEGMQKGILEGIQKTAKNLLKIKLDLASIQKVTGLSKGQIEALVKK